MALDHRALSLPGTFFISNDAFYFGMLPILAEAGAHYGVEPMAIARASLMGQPVHLLSPLVPRPICWSVLPVGPCRSPAFHAGSGGAVLPGHDDRGHVVSGFSLRGVTGGAHDRPGPREQMIAILYRRANRR
jgi:hypothetical protein